MILIFSEHPYLLHVVHSHTHTIYICTCMYCFCELYKQKPVKWFFSFLATPSWNTWPEISDSGRRIAAIRYTGFGLKTRVRQIRFKNFLSIKCVPPRSCVIRVRQGERANTEIFGEKYQHLKKSIYSSFFELFLFNIVYFFPALMAWWGSWRVQSPVFCYFLYINLSVYVS